MNVGFRHVDGPWLFRGLSTQLQADRTYALTGPSGSGKSSLLGLLAGHLRVTEGSLSGRPSEVQWVFQNPFGDPSRVALDHVTLPFIARGLSRSEAETQAGELLATFGLDAVATHLYSELSGGQAHRLMLARALACRPELLLVDEPTSQLDALAAMRVTQALSELAGRGAIVVVATHDPQVLESCQEEIDLLSFTFAGASS